MRASKLPLLIRSLGASAVALGALLVAAPATAQIKQPGNHPKYNVELEPHFLVQWAYTNWASDGLGLGLRASIPIIDNGPVTTINNNFAIGFGLDWAHFGNDCNNYYYGGVRVRPYNYGCSGNQFWLPIVAQWNFFFTPVVSAFAELGFGIRHQTWNVACGGVNNLICGRDYSETDVNPVFAIGARFHVADSFALTLRMGIPYLSIGGSFFL